MAGLKTEAYRSDNGLYYVVSGLTSESGTNYLVYRTVLERPVFQGSFKSLDDIQEHFKIELEEA